MMVSIPILVAGLDPSGSEFTEETRTVVVNREGALILLRHELARDNRIRIINLQNEAAADFRIVGPTRLASEDGTEWGVEYMKAGMEIWGVDFPAPSAETAPNASALLECQVCHKKYFWPLTLVEVEVLETTGVIENFCNPCGRQTTWVYAETSRQPQPLPTSIQVGVTQLPVGEERRENKRLLLKLPVLVKDSRSGSETGKTENVSHADLAVALALDLTVGEFVKVICPLTATGKNLERSARVMRKATHTIKDRNLYGMRYAIPPDSAT